MNVFWKSAICSTCSSYPSDRDDFQFCFCFNTGFAHMSAQTVFSLLDFLHLWIQSVKEMEVSQGEGNPKYL